MKTEYYNEERYKRAKKRIKEIKGFYWHLFWYLVVNIFITFGSTISDMFRGDSITLNELHFGMFSVWFFWGIGLAGHWLKVFGKNIIFSKNWEDRKINEYMEKDQNL